MQSKGISVIMTTFNGAAFIKQQLDSILLQTHQADEIIICDDSSTDDTISILKSYADYPRIKIFVNDIQLGVVENFKKAAKIATTGNWLVFADQDDIWLPIKIERLAAEMQIFNDDSLPVLIYSDLKVIDKNDNVISSSFWQRQQIKIDKIRFSTLLYGNVVTGCTIIINYKMAEEFFLMDATGVLHDEWMALIAYSIGKAKQVNDKLVLYRQHAANITFSESYTENKGDLKHEAAKGGNLFLRHQFNLAKIFLSRYEHKLNQDQIKTITRFINQENKSYLIQRVNRRITFL